MMTMTNDGDHDQRPTKVTMTMTNDGDNNYDNDQWL